MIIIKNNRKYSLALLLAIGFLLTTTLCGAEPNAPFPTSPFVNGDRWTAIGDSITHGRKYYAWVYLYYVTRFPEMQLEVSNAGNSGDDADGTLERYNWDIKPKNPTVASLMLGMNDVRREIYGDMPVTPQLRDQRIYILEGYRSFMTKLIKRLQKDNVRLILLTPSIYDETAENPKTKILTGVNGALGECAEFIKEVARETGATLIDFHGPMTKLTEQIQKKDPKASLISRDRVHPHPAGSFVMSYLFLDAIKAPGIVSSITIDSAKSKVVEVENANVEKFKSQKDMVSFTLKEKSLPFPVGKEQKAALEWVPFQEKFNQEQLKVTGLAPGNYELSIDNKVVRQYSAQELAAGVNLALQENTPQAIQSAEVLKLMLEWHKQILKARSIASFEFWKLGDLPHPISLETAQNECKPLMDKVSDTTIKENRWKLKAIQRYLERKPRQNEIKTQLKKMGEDIHLAAQPKPHHYVLKAVQ